MATNPVQWRDSYYFINDAGEVYSNRFGKMKRMKGNLQTGGYRQVNLYGKNKLVHRLVSECFLDEYLAVLQFDHIDGNRTNNVIGNLRMASHSENGRNAKSYASSSSKYKGVHWHKPTKKWVAQINRNGTPRYLGLFENEEEAARAFDTAARALHSEFCRYNFPAENEQSALQ